MKGVIFAEIINWIEEGFGLVVADKVIEQANCESKGVYTSIGSYPHDEALKMMVALSDISQREIPDLADAYGYWLAPRFVELYPEMFEGYTDVVTFLRDVDESHHREVKKLYPDAKTPSVVAVVDGEEFTVSYASHRPFADVAHGLIRGYIEYYNDDLIVVRDEAVEGPHAARFKIMKDNATHSKAA